MYENRINFKILRAQYQICEAAALENTVQGEGILGLSSSITVRRFAC